jgi:hypothetical protein
MIITPEQIDSYLYCPIRYFDFKNPPREELDIWRKKIKETILLTEKRVLMHDSFITVKKLINKWDDVWWSYAIENNVDVEKTKELSLKAAVKFTEYCRYDFSSDLFETMASDVYVDKEFSSDLVLRSRMDIVKRDLTDKSKHVYLINFEKVDRQTIHTNLKIIARIYPFFLGGTEIIYYLSLDFGGKNLTLNKFVFRKEELDKYHSALYYLCRGIKSKTKYPNIYNCKECNLCTNFK